LISLSLKTRGGETTFVAKPFDKMNPAVTPKRIRIIIRGVFNFNIYEK